MLSTNYVIAVLHTPQAKQLLLAGWILLVLGGAWNLLKYSNQTVQHVPVVDYWPEHSELVLGNDGLTMVAFFHPKCVCSRATVNQLKRVLASRKNVQMNLVSVFFCPQAEAVDWTNTPLFKTVTEIADCQLFIDRNSEEASKFGVNTSGHILVFSETGHQLFAGGITSSRGHEGACAGSTALSQVMSKSSAQRTRFPVFGCQLSGQFSEGARREN